MGLKKILELAHHSPHLEFDRHLHVTLGAGTSGSAALEEAGRGRKVGGTSGMEAAGMVAGDMAGDMAGRAGEGQLRQDTRRAAWRELPRSLSWLPKNEARSLLPQPPRSPGKSRVAAREAARSPGTARSSAAREGKRSEGLSPEHRLRNWLEPRKARHSHPKCPSAPRCESQ